MLVGKPLGYRDDKDSQAVQDGGYVAGSGTGQREYRDHGDEDGNDDDPPRNIISSSQVASMNSPLDTKEPPRDWIRVTAGMGYQGMKKQGLFKFLNGVVCTWGCSRAQTIASERVCSALAGFMWLLSASATGVIARVCPRWRGVVHSGR